MFSLVSSKDSPRIGFYSTSFCTLSKSLRFLFVIIFCFLTCTSSVFAVTDEFTVRLLVGSDSTPPTTPTLTSATPASVAQITLSWTASTDNLALSGYQVFRNASQIATTSLTSYSDSGLSASTLYSYSIRAFDTSFNYSSTSNTLATTTLTPPATTTPTSGGSSSSGSKSTVLQEFQVVPELYSALFTWDTSTFVKFDLRWGRTSSYELGYVSNDVWKREHTTRITDLVPGTVYEYELTAFDKNGKQITLKSGQFKTLSLPDSVAPTNVKNLKARVVGDSVVLSWINPDDPDFSNVRIVRSHLFYPNDTADGFVAYQGEDGSFTDTSIFKTFEKVYYTVFAYDTLGNVSSGAVVTVTKNGAVTTPSYDDTLETKYSLTFTDFEFEQNQVPMGLVGLDATVPFFVRIDYQKLPEHLKTITMTLRTTDQADATYLLRINSDKTAYEAQVAPLERESLYDIFFTVYDFDTKTMQTVSGVVQLYMPRGTTGERVPFLFKTTEALSSTVLTVATVLFLSLLIFLFIFFFKKIKRG